MAPENFRFGSFVLDPAARELRHGETVVVVPARAFACLHYLIAHRERAVSRDELAQAVFGRSNVSDAQIGQIVLRARRAVDDDGHGQNAIRTVPRYGFRWVASTQVESRQEPSWPTAIDGSRDSEAAMVAVEPLTAPMATIEPPLAAGNMPARQRWRTRPVLLAALALLVAGCTLAWWWLRPPEPLVQAQARAVTLVLPTEVLGAGDAAWARLGLMDFIADRMRRAGLAVPPSENTLVMLGNRDDQAGMVPPMAQRVIRSVAEKRNATWRVKIEAQGEDRVKATAVAEDKDLLAATASASDRLLATLGRQPPASGGDLDLQERLQRARAAMLANEVDSARRILLAAPELQRDTPELLYQLARIEFREGRFEQGLAGLDRALRSPAGKAPLFRARLLNARGAMHVRLERSSDAERDFDAALALLDPTDNAAETAQALTGRGVARAMQRRFDASLADLGHARVQALRAGDPLAASRIDANLGQLEMDRDRPAQALPYLVQAARDFEDYGAINELVTARSALVAINLRLLRYRAAWQDNQRGWALRARVRDPAQLNAMTLDRAEILIRQGQLRAAGKLLDATPDPGESPGEAQRRVFLRMEAAWRAGDAKATLQRVSEAIAVAGSAPSPQLQGWLRLRQRQAALRADAHAAAWPSQVQAPEWLEALTRALGERQAGREAAADAAYREALRSVESEGVPEDVLETIADYAPWLIERGRLGEASALVGRVAPWAEQDFDAAVLQWRLYRALGQQALADKAQARARALAGERPLPSPSPLADAVPGIGI